MQHSREAKTFFAAIGVISIVAFVFFLYPYLALVIFASLLAVLFYPLYRRVYKWTNGRSWFALLTAFLAILLTFILPLAVAIGLAVRVLTDFAQRVNGLSIANGLSINWIVDRLNSFLGAIPGINYQLSLDQVVTQIQRWAASLGSGGFGSLQSIGEAVFGVIPALFISFYVISAIFVNYNAISRFLHKLSPLDDVIDRLYVKRIKSMTLSMVRGTFFIALIQGVLTGVFLWVAGVRYAAFFGLLATIASIIPLGAGVVAIPIGILLIATGSLWQGILQIAGNFLIVSNVDNILRPKLVSKDASLHPALVMLGLFAGIAHFGFLGAVYGPVLMIFFVTTLEVYLKYFRQESSESEGGDTENRI